MLNETDNDCGKSATVSASNAVLNNSASSVCVSVKQRSNGAGCCGGRCKSRALVAQITRIVGVMVGNIAHCKITPTQSAGIAQMVGQGKRRVGRGLLGSGWEWCNNGSKRGGGLERVLRCTNCYTQIFFVPNPLLYIRNLMVLVFLKSAASVIGAYRFDSGLGHHAVWRYRFNRR